MDKFIDQLLISKILKPVRHSLAFQFSLTIVGFSIWLNHIAGFIYKIIPITINTLVLQTLNNTKKNEIIFIVQGRVTEKSKNRKYR